MDQLCKRIDSYYDNMVSTLETLVNIDSGADCPEGIKEVAANVGDHLKSIGFQVEYLDYPGIATHVLATRKGTAPDARNVMIIGHLDTVFPKGTAAARPFRQEHGIAYGPGVLDMKSGVTIALYALRAMSELDLIKNNVTVMFVGDEEAGHPYTDAAEQLRKAAAGKDAVFNMETGSDKGTVVLGRTGIYYPEITVEGIAAHSGKDPEKGASAVRELVYKLVDLYRFSDTDDNISFNAGIITGGVAANGIAAHAEMKGDFRYKTVDSGPKILKALEEICAKTYVPRTQTKLVCDPNRGFIPMEKTEANVALYNVVREQGAKIGVNIEGITVGAGSDSCYTSVVGAPTVCAMGARGELNHSAQEYMRLDSLTERAKILALSILAI
ncbi:MAG: M20 family metallopeptidase [Oscillospiraceae bacterium]|uniref:Glutamate carboxypeptidase n=1 Tax=Pusillibacter faecalis TaxID=2714358 RepID=A0A810QIW3_9FIRM|nr:M20 family metallopeptidase [Pusillibacter faecalis]MBS5659118.1 M20 family metallopeptidase [Oscillibacter sp.]MCQ5027620.1 M20 family metallopeptidase [Oscillibacter valericigenes]BCK84393.1 glutamate carboxypeptidase [Pusillibacter faecalis]